MTVGGLLMIVAHKRAEVIPKTSLSSHLPIPPIFTIATQLNQSQDCSKSEKHGIYFWVTCVPRPIFCSAFCSLIRESSIFSKSHPDWPHQDQQIAFVFPFCDLNLSSPWCSIILASWKDQQTNTNHMTYVTVFGIIVSSFSFITEVPLCINVRSTSFVVIVDKY